MKTTLMMKGFYLEGTGGGCTALRRDLPEDKYLLVTDDDACAPTEETKVFIVGFYGREDEQLDYEECGSMEEVRAIISRWGWL